MKWCLTFCASLVFILTFSRQVQALNHAMRVLEVKGQVIDESSPQGPKPWTLKSKVDDKLFLKLSSGSSTKIQLSSNMRITAYGPAEFEIPTINWENGHFKRFRVKSGAVRFENSKGSEEVEIETPFFKISAPIGSWVFRMHPELALADLMALEGSLDLGISGTDEKVSLQPGQRATFRGLLEEGEIAYDLLLEGRKVPKGRWEKPTQLTKEDLALYSFESERRIQAAEARRRQKQKSAEEARQNRNLCVNPAGNLNDCYWKKNDKICQRFRCAADGKWKDPQSAESSQCQGHSHTTVKSCDY